ncbi:class I adenylate-forming enzyme family protein [Brevibacterium sp. VCM10]|uniref:class I adenylate-forming enzyme family protein n=1 Tax=Brevibacterium sp. VCM10 TaxID=1381751 RepID=UPI0004B7F988|nr:class I adenylate-forming enzyme family protein [Brevibacterium sp. VCM10]
MGMSLNFVTDSVYAQMPVVDPEATAVVLGTEETMSWRQLREAELRYARILQRCGVAPGDRVAILLRNSTDYVAWYLAIGRVGAIGVRLNWRLTGPEIEFALSDSETSVLILDAEFLATIETIRDRIPVRTHLVRGREDTGVDWAEPLTALDTTHVDLRDTDGFPVVSPDDPVTLMYSSGTTGRPKGALFSHANAAWIGSIQAQRWGIGATSVAQTSGPLFHAGGFEVLLLPTLLAHGTIVTFPSGGFSLDSFLEVASARGTTDVLLYPFMLFDLLRDEKRAAAFPDDVRRIVTGGDIVMPWVYDEMERLLPGVELVQSYSLTEGGAVSTSLEFDVARGHESSIGRPQAMTEVKVVRPDGELADVDEVGEICVRSGGVSIGYWNRPEATAATFEDGWCHSGDLGKVDAEGYLSIAGRAKDMYRSGGENVYPAEVEMVLTGHPDIADIAVIGVPDEKYVEVGAALIVPVEGRELDVDGLRIWARERLAKYKIPVHFHIRETLPRNVNGKLQKMVLRDEYARMETH